MTDHNNFTAKELVLLLSSELKEDIKDIKKDIATLLSNQAEQAEINKRISMQDDNIKKIERDFEQFKVKYTKIVIAVGIITYIAGFFTKVFL